MKKVTIECEVLDYDELPADYKVRLLHEEFDSVREMLEFGFLVDEFKEELDVIGFENAQVWFSGFGSQGDGARFDATVNLVKVCKHLGIGYNPEEDDWTCEIETINSHYNHERTRRVNFNATKPGLLMSDTASLVASVEEKIEDLRLKLCKDFYKKLQEDAEGQTSEESLLESLRARSYSMRGSIVEQLINAAECENVEVL